MSSWIRCDCGNLLHANLFAGAGVALFIPEEVLEEDFEGMSAEIFIERLVAQATKLITCSKCLRLHKIPHAGAGTTYTQS